MALTRLSVVIHGVPAPKGSMRAAGNRVIPSGSPQNAIAQRSWETCVRDAVRQALDERDQVGVIPFVDQAIGLRIQWRLRRPKSHFVAKGPASGTVKPTAPVFCTVPPDSSKLLRAIEDHFNQLVWDDDSRIARTAMTKIYAAPGTEGATVEVVALDPVTGNPREET